MQEIKAPARQSFGWLLFVLGSLMGLGLGLLLFLHLKEKPVEGPEIAKWESNWLQLKIGLTKEQVLTLVGAPSSTFVMDSQVTSINTYPPNPKAQQQLQDTLDHMSFAVWTYYGTMIIHTMPGENLDTAMKQVADQTNVGMNGKLQGHAIKFNSSGKIAEISSQ